MLEMFLDRKSSLSHTGASPPDGDCSVGQVSALADEHPAKQPEQGSHQSNTYESGQDVADDSSHPGEAVVRQRGRPPFRKSLQSAGYEAQSQVLRVRLLPTPPRLCPRPGVQSAWPGPPDPRAPHRSQSFPSFFAGTSALIRLEWVRCRKANTRPVARASMGQAMRRCPIIMAGIALSQTVGTVERRAIGGVEEVRLEAELYGGEQGCHGQGYVAGQNCRHQTAGRSGF